MINWKSCAASIALALGVAQGVFAAELKTITVAGGCFWCVESDFESVRGVKDAVSGFTGGAIKDPTYKQVTQGGTGHLEAVQITYDPSQVTARQLYDLFFRSIDPTDAGGQFCDRGESYTTAIFSGSNNEQKAAVAAKSSAEKVLGRKIVTPVLTASEFYPADTYHQDYYKQSARILTRFGPLKKSVAYKRYRESCGRDARVLALWGDAAPFAKH